MVDRVGQQLGNYRLIRLLGKGGFAEVYLGEHIYLRNLAAIKVLYARLHQEEMERFLTEARTLAQLVHPHIVRVLEFGIEGETPYLVMDYAPNGTLRQHTPKGRALPVPTVVTYVQQIADALEYAHQQKLIHRDIKPENMLVGRRSEVLLSDFGIALVAQSSRHQSTQDMVGTVTYMAPEQIQGKPRPASDQYALGTVAYEWLTGERPFSGSFTEIVAQHLSVPPRPLREKNPTLSPAVEAAVLRTLEKDPHLRFPGIQSFAQALEQASQQTSLSTSQAAPFTGTSSSPLYPAGAASTLNTQTENLNTPSNALLRPTEAITPPGIEPTIEARPPFVQTSSAAPDTQKATQPRSGLFTRRAVITSIAGLAAAGIAGGGITWAIKSRPSPAPTPSGGKTSLPPGSLLYTYHGHTDAITAVSWSPDGKYVASASADNTVQVWNAMTGSRKTTYKDGTYAAETIAWSPNGRYIALQIHVAIPSVHSYYEILRVLDLTTSNVTIDYQHGGPFAWSPESETIAFISSLDVVEMWDAATGTLQTDFQGNPLQFIAIAWSPNGKLIVAGDTQGYFQVWDTTTGNLILSDRTSSGIIECICWSPDSKYIAIGTFGGNVEIWDAAAGNVKATYQGDVFLVSSVAWSPDGKLIALSANINTVKVIDASTAKTRIDYNKNNPLPVTTAAWSPKGTYIASISNAGTVEVWNAINGRLITNYKGHFGKVESLAWSPDGSKIASGAEDKTVQVWAAV